MSLELENGQYELTQRVNALTLQLAELRKRTLSLEMDFYETKNKGEEKLTASKPPQLAQLQKDVEALQELLRIVVFFLEGSTFKRKKGGKVVVNASEDAFIALDHKALELKERFKL